MEQQNDSSTPSQTKHPATAPVLAAPALKSSVPTTTGPPPHSACILGENPISPAVTAVTPDHHVLQVTLESKQPLSAPATVPVAPQPCVETTKTEIIVSDSDTAKTNVMETDRVERLSAQIVSAPMVTNTPECQSRELLHASSNSPIPSTPNTLPPQILSGHQPRPEGQLLQQQEQEQPREAQTSGRTPEPANARFETMLSKSFQNSILLRKGKILALEMLRSIFTDTIDVTAAVPDDVQDSLLFWEGESLLFERVSIVAIALDIVTRDYVECMTHYSRLSDLSLQLYESPTHIMVTPGYYCNRMLEDLFVSIAKFRGFIKSLVEKLGVEARICNSFRKATERSYHEVQRASSNHESSILSLHNRISVLRELETRLQAVVKGGSSMFDALEKPWQAVLCRSLSSSDHITTSSGSREHVDGRRDCDNKLLSRMLEQPSVNHPDNAKAKSRFVLPCDSNEKCNDDGIESGHCPPHPENPRSAVDDSPKETVELDLGIVSELHLKSKIIPPRIIYDKAERGEVVMKSMVGPAVSVRQAYEKEATKEAEASETARKLEPNKTELAKKTKKKEGADGVPGEEGEEGEEGKVEPGTAETAVKATKAAGAEISEEVKEPAEPEVVEQPGQPMEEEAAADAAKAREVEKIKENVVAEAEIAKTKEKEERDKTDLKGKATEKAEKTGGEEGIQDTGNKEGKAVPENRISTSQPFEHVETEQRFPTQVSLRHDRKRSSSSQGHMAEEATPMENIPVAIDRTVLDGRESPFPKSIKSIQAYGDIASFADLNQPDIRISSAPLPTSRYSEEPAAAPLPKFSTVPTLKIPEGPQLVAAAETTAAETTAAKTATAKTAAKELQLYHSQPDAIDDCCESKLVMPTCKQTDMENPSKMKSQGPS